ncbi:DUF3008 family protein [Haloferula chungangensis]|uniref:DUF3008 family protein n=1 Tax=Haloferula chungangensis TaxID=1048331 RepID=A0ABW2L2B8_9BACT
MKSVSKSQQRSAREALAAKRGEVKASSLRGASKQMHASMPKSELEKISSSPRRKPALSGRGRARANTTWMI